jgi:uncharacterized membrane protein
MNEYVVTILFIIAIVALVLATFTAMFPIFTFGWSFIFWFVVLLIGIRASIIKIDP